MKNNSGKKKKKVLSSNCHLQLLYKSISLKSFFFHIYFMYDDVKLYSLF